MTKDDFAKFKYLVVDDDDLARDIIAVTLGRIGATQILFAEDATTALHMAQQHRPDFILLDIYMPDVDGWTLLDQVRHVLPQVVAVMVTGSRHGEDFTQSLDQRADGFCVKPVMPQVMEKALTNARHRRLAAAPSARTHAT
jgi:CheY-like chemotaxis protein